MSNHAKVKIENFVVVFDVEGLDDGEIIHRAAQSIITQLEVDERAFDWKVERVTV